ncbi:hypothetical protein L6452_16441 [Arctium lappa]|uniref:Uncharacterized protein n=1 Tax=Arctium lappa TaxID=4217 RepID=A0ACB9C0H9_ARCLA|nr:hypothetical protein L6452_16441 [Arctium lappa]
MKSEVKIVKMGFLYSQTPPAIVPGDCANGTIAGAQSRHSTTLGTTRAIVPGDCAKGTIATTTDPTVEEVSITWMVKNMIASQKPTESLQLKLRKNDSIGDVKNLGEISNGTMVLYNVKCSASKLKKKEKNYWMVGLNSSKLFCIICKSPDKFPQAGVIEEIVNDVVDSALDSDDIEDEIDEEVDKVLTAIAGENAAQLPEAVRKERLKQPAQTTEDEEILS